MLTIKEFKKRLERLNSPDWLHVAIDTDNKDQFYIVGNGGMGATISAPIEQYKPEIKSGVIDMLNSGKLVIDEKRSLLLDRNILVHYLSLSGMANTLINNFEGD